MLRDRRSAELGAQLVLGFSVRVASSRLGRDQPKRTRSGLRLPPRLSTVIGVPDEIAHIQKRRQFHCRRDAVIIPTVVAS